MTTMMSETQNIFIIVCVIVSATFTTGLPASSGLAKDYQFSDECILKSDGIYLSLSSEAEFLNDSILRWLEVRWWGITNPQPGDYIGLWDHNPNTSLTTGILEAFLIINTPDGGFRLETRWDGSLFPNTLPSQYPACLNDYWVGYVRNDSVLLYSSCITLNPNWMNDNKDILANVGIAEAALPGIHDAGAYETSDLLISGNDEIGRFTFTQDESLWQNMVLGVRYFDMRISYYENTDEKYFVNHGDVRIRPLVDYLNQTSTFLRSTTEIIIFDVHSFEHNLDSNYTNVINLQALIESYLGDLMAPNYYGLNARLEQFWVTDKRIIVTLPITTSSSLYWSSAHQLWGNTDEINDFYNYFDQNIPSLTGSGSMWSCQAQFTPTVLDTTLNKWGGLRGAANITNEPTTLWLRREWWQMVNIFSMDFMASSGVIETVIEINQMRDQCNILITPSSIMQ